MDNSLRILLRLWWIQRARDFTWRKLFVAAYIAVAYIVMVLAVYAGISQQTEHIVVPPEYVALMPLLAVCIVPGDMLMKLFWRRSPVEMDDYLRSRPVTPRSWARFVLFDTCVGFLQWMLPLMLAFVVLVLCPWWWALMVLVQGYAGTMTNALVQNCWRRAPGNEWTLPLAAGYVVWLLLTMLAAGATFGVFAIGDVAASLTATQGTLIAAGVLLLADVVVMTVLHAYFCRMKNYNEECHHAAATTAHSLGEVSVWSIEWVQLLRSKRLRVSIIAMAVIFILNTYMQQATTVADAGIPISVNPMLLFGVGFPSIIIGQWVLGVEANYFAAIWTRPWGLTQLLLRKYWCMCLLCCLMALCIVPAVVWMGMPPTTLLATLLFACGVMVLPFMATALFSSRMDLFNSAFFNYQGGNKQLNIFSCVLFIPIGIFYAAYFFLPMLWADALLAALGLLGLALHRVYIRFVARRWFARRYDIMERWLRE